MLKSFTNHAVTMAKLAVYPPLFILSMLFMAVALRRKN